MPMSNRVGLEIDGDSKALGSHARHGDTIGAAKIANKRMRSGAATCSRLSCSLISSTCRFDKMVSQYVALGAKLFLVVLERKR